MCEDPEGRRGPGPGPKDCIIMEVTLNKGELTTGFCYLTLCDVTIEGHEGSVSGSLDPDKKTWLNDAPGVTHCCSSFLNIRDNQGPKGPAHS